MISASSLDQLNARQLRSLAAQLIQNVEHLDKEVLHHKTLNQQLTHEIALLKYHCFAKRAESFSPTQASLLDDLLESDLAAIEAELKALAPKSAVSSTHQQPRHTELPAEFPRTLIHHEPDDTLCNCGYALKRISEDVSEKLDYTPAVFTVERHIRGQWVCDQCETLTQAPVPAHVIEKGIPTAGLLARIMIDTYADHLPLYRQEIIFGRAGLAIPRSTLAHWVGACSVQLQPLVDALRDVVLEHSVMHADKTPVQKLASGSKKNHRAYVWAYATTSFSDISAVVYDFSLSGADEQVHDFLQDWQGKLVCGDFGDYKASVERAVIEIGCMAHARHKFYDLHATNKSKIAEQTLPYFAQLYEIECEVRGLEPDQRQQLRKEKAAPIMDALQAWMITQRQLVPMGSAIARALDYSLKRWLSLMRYLDDGRVPIDNSWVVNQIRPWEIARSNWLFAGSLRSGKRAAALMSLIQSAKLNGHDPYEYLKNVLERLPTQKMSKIVELLPHNWEPHREV